MNIWTVIILLIIINIIMVWKIGQLEYKLNFVADTLRKTLNIIAKMNIKKGDK